MTPRLHRPHVEALEDRTVPSGVDIIVRDSTLILGGSNDADAFDQGIVRVVNNKVVARVVKRDLSGTVQQTKILRVPLTTVTWIVFLGKAGDDIFRNRTAITASAHGGAGNDRLFGGAGNEFLRGGAGHDALWGGEGNDALYGEGGNDQLFGEAGDDSLVGGTGHDLLRGGDGKDTLSGDGGNDTLYGDGGDDILFALAGNDFLFGGAGNDLLYGGDGNDPLYGGDGNDQLYGEAGDDTLRGGIGDDRMYGGAGLDYLYGDAGADYLDGGWDGAKDQLWGGTEKDVFRRYYTLGFFGIHVYPEEDVNDFEGILGSWDTFDEFYIGP